MKRTILLIASLISLAACADQDHSAPAVTSVEHKNGLTKIHHRKRLPNGATDRIESINDKTGVTVVAEYRVYDVGRMPSGDNGMTEATRYYRMERSPSFDYRLPKKIGAGPREASMPPTYTPVPDDQRVKDKVAELEQEKGQIAATVAKVQNKLQEDTALKGVIVEQKDKIQELTDRINSLMATPKKAPPAQSEAAKAGQAAADNDSQALMDWAHQKQ